MRLLKTVLDEIWLRKFPQGKCPACGRRHDHGTRSTYDADSPNLRWARESRCPYCGRTTAVRMFEPTKGCEHGLDHVEAVEVSG